MTATVTSMRLKFPEFAGQSDGFVDLALEEASRWVDPAIYLARDVDIATMYLAAHYMMVSIARQESGSGQVVKSERFGSELAITYETPSSFRTSPEDDDYSTTFYGKRFLRLARANNPGVALI